MKIKSIVSKFKPKKSVSDNISYPNFCLEASKNKNVFETTFKVEYAEKPNHTVRAPSKDL